MGISKRKKEKLEPGQFRPGLFDYLSMFPISPGLRKIRGN
jgi:hypothetical protein